MLTTIPESHLNEPDPAVVGTLNIAENLFLAIVTVVAVLNLAGWLVPVKGLLTSVWSAMSVESALAALLSGAGLAFSRSRYGLRLHALSIGIASLVAIGSGLVLAGHLVYAAPAAVSGTAFWIAKGMSLQAAGCFGLLGLTIVLSRVRQLGFVADLSTFVLLFSVAVLVAGQLMAVTHVFGPISIFVISGGTALCLLLLAAVLLFRRAESGVFSILLGRGIGSKVARILAPVVLAGPYLREEVRARILSSQPIPRHYLAALLATGAVVLGIAILLYLAWRLNALEAEIQGLSLRDALTGLYNLRGFRLLSEQSLLLARRSGQPFSVLFIDVDNLKLINDALGHQTGSDLLVATAEILRDSFRETDVLGRIGGDEFAVAGQFSEESVAESVERLRQAAMLYNANAAKSSLRFSAGWATAAPEEREPLADLLAKADAQMYHEKRRRKASAKGSSKISPEADPTTALPPDGEMAELRELDKTVLN